MDSDLEKLLETSEEESPANSDEEVSEQNSEDTEDSDILAASNAMIEKIDQNDKNESKPKGNKNSMEESEDTKKSEDESEDEEDEMGEPKKKKSKFSSSEGRVAFEVMRVMVKQARKRIESKKSAFRMRRRLQECRLPSCLNDIIQSGQTNCFPCTLCGKTFPNPEQLICHADDHVSRQRIRSRN